MVDILYLLDIKCRNRKAIMSNDDNADDKFDNSEELFDNSNLIAELISKISSCDHEAIGVLSLTIGRMCYRNSVSLDDVTEMIKDGFATQKEIDEESEELSAMEVERLKQSN